MMLQILRLLPRPAAETALAAAQRSASSLYVLLGTVVAMCCGGFLSGGAARERRRVDALKLKKGQTVVLYGYARSEALLRTVHLLGPLGRLICVDRRLAVVASIRRLARRQHLRQIETVHAAGQPLPLTSQLADVVYACEVLPCGGDPLDQLAELARLLRPGGRLILENSLWSNRRTMALVAAVPGLCIVKSSGRQVRCRRLDLPSGPVGGVGGTRHESSLSSADAAERRIFPLRHGHAIF